jgi:hypothetical protein
MRPIIAGKANDLSGPGDRRKKLDAPGVNQIFGSGEVSVGILRDLSQKRFIFDQRKNAPAAGDVRNINYLVVGPYYATKAFDIICFETTEFHKKSDHAGTTTESTSF